jgi:hypothetical protein
MGKSVDFYISKGYSHPMAEYYAAGRKQLVGLMTNDDFTLTLTFDNGEIRKYDMKPLLIPGTVFAHFMKIEDFRRAYIDDSHAVCWDIDPNIDSNIVWSNKVDICPDCCYVDSVPVSGGVIGV